MNYGDLNIGAGSHYLMAMYDNFDRIYGFNICSYKQRPDKFDHTICHDNFEGDSGLVFRTSLLSNELYSCGHELEDPQQ